MSGLLSNLVLLVEAAGVWAFWLLIVSVGVSGALLLCLIIITVREDRRERRLKAARRAELRYEQQAEIFEFPVGSATSARVNGPGSARR